VCGGTDEDDVGEEEAGTRHHCCHRIQRDEVGENTTRPCHGRHIWRDKARARHHCRCMWRDGLGDDGDGTRMLFVFVWQGHVEGERMRRG
jgi:hypothetical protein